LYEMMTGTVPFQGDSAVSIALKHINEKMRPPSELNPNISNNMQLIINKCVEKDPRKRYKDASQLLDDLNRVSDDPDCVLPQELLDDNQQTLSIKPVFEDKLILKPSKTDKRTIIMVSIGLVLVLLIIFTGFRIFNRQTDNNETIVPYLIGLSEQEAENILDQHYLRMNISGRENSKQYDDGLIMSQIHPEGSSVLKNTIIDVIISIGPQTVLVPNVVGLLLRDAEQLIENEGLAIEQIQYLNSNFPSGTVIRQSLPGETLVNYNSYIVLVVSRGPEINVVEVSRYVGLRQDLAESLIIKDNLVIGVVTLEHNAQFPENTIIRQQPPEGAIVEQNRAINIWVSLGPEPTFRQKLEIRLEGIVNDDVVNIRLERKIDGYVVYENEHFLNEEVVVIELEESGTVVYRLYIDDLFHEELTVDFTKKEDI